MNIKFCLLVAIEQMIERVDGAASSKKVYIQMNYNEKILSAEVKGAL